MNSPCSRCGAALAPTDLDCAECHALVHSAKLDELAASARLHEDRRENAAARDDWRAASALLPPGSAQAAWVRDKLQQLGSSGAEAPTKKDRAHWTARLGPFAPLALLLTKGKLLLGLFQLKFLLTFGSFIAVYWAIYGAKFGLGFAVLVLVHELGHFVAVKRRGLPADLPVFLPGVGAYVRWAAVGVPAETRAYISLAGPAAGLLGASVCGLLWVQTADQLWLGLASFSALINLLNLIPVWALDGGQAFSTLDRSGRLGIAITAAVMAVLFKQPILFLIAGGAVYRLFTKDLALQTNFGVTVYYALLLAGLGYLATLAPLHLPAR